MSRSRRIVNVAFATVVLLGFFPTITISKEGEKEPCTGKFVGQRPTEKQLDEVLKLHGEWLGLEGKEARLKDVVKRANLCGADLTEANLRRTLLLQANLSKARLVMANLSEADLSEANLSEARLLGANLSKAVLKQANLSGAHLVGNLREANLAWANLRGAVFRSADMREADLTEADFANTYFYRTKVPNFDSWRSAKNLSLVTFDLDGVTLSEFHRLREGFKKNGMRTEERGITAALERAQTRAPETNPLERGFRLIAFDATAEYGNAPGRPLIILLSGIFLFALPYTVALMVKNSSWRGAIWMVWNEDRLIDSSRNENEKKRRGRLSGLAFPKALLYGLYFSLLSAFHFGWRDLNVGNWIARIQPREYALRASGWVRTVSGVQSLLSVYLVALWALTYFGRPFE